MTKHWHFVRYTVSSRGLSVFVKIKTLLAQPGYRAPCADGEAASVIVELNDHQQVDCQHKVWPLMVQKTVLLLVLIQSAYYGKALINYLKIYSRIFDTQGFIIGGDFINYWSAARLVLAKNVMALFDLQGFHRVQESLLEHPVNEIFNWSYPPFLLPWLSWLGLMPYPVALLAWLGVTFLAYAYSVAAGRPKPWGVALVLLLAPASFENALHGQNGFLSAALLVGGLRLLNTRPALAGILLGCLSYKPQIALLVPVALFVSNRWSAVLAAITTIIVLVSCSVWLYGIEPWQYYLHGVIPYQGLIMEIDPHRAATYPKMMPTVFMSIRILGGSLVEAYGATIVTALGSVAAVVYAFRRCRSTDLRNAVLLTATFLTSPYLFSYDMPILGSGIVAFVAAVGHKLRWFHLLLLSFAWLLPSAIFYFNSAGIPVAPCIIGALLLLELYFVRTQKPEPLDEAVKSCVAN